MATTKSEYLISNSPVSSLTADFKSHKAQFVEKHGVEFSISSLKQPLIKFYIITNKYMIYVGFINLKYFYYMSFDIN